ncbi:hypothetical protein [Mycoplasma sp. CSL10166]|uniref:hypothetical protein n=1 Tax=Mycoplasma sp. CSL10166 TaxID=2813825 RepID=UPI00197C8A05|nr:hypothetical protein [Mycoplasma sp. CSL10166]MBN4084087.1 hypothetical protein [Mycoplasma sp. CSL10166]
MNIKHFFNIFKKIEDIHYLEESLKVKLVKMNIITLFELSSLNDQFIIDNFDQKQADYIIKIIKFTKQNYIINDFDNIVFFRTKKYEENLFNYSSDFFIYKDEKYKEIIKLNYIKSLYELYESMFKSEDFNKEEIILLNKIYEEQTKFTKSDLENIRILLKNYISENTFSENKITYNEKFIDYILKNKEQFIEKTNLKETLITKNAENEHKEENINNEYNTFEIALNIYKEWFGSIDINYEISKPILKNNILTIKKLIDHKFSDKHIEKMRSVNYKKIKNYVLERSNYSYYYKNDIISDEDFFELKNKKYFNLNLDSIIEKNSFIEKIINTNNFKKISDIYDFKNNIALTPSKMSKVNSFINGVKLIEKDDIFQLIEIRKVYKNMFKNLFYGEIIYLKELLNNVFEKMTSNIETYNYLPIYQEYIINLLKKSNKYKTTDELFENIVFKNESLQRVVDKLSLNENIRRKNDLWLYKHESINSFDFDKQIENYSKIINSKDISGENLFLRETIKNKILNLNTHFLEDRFSYIYEEYDISINEIKKYFNASEIESNYLYLFYRKGKTPLENALFDEKIPKENIKIIKIILLNERKRLKIDNDWISLKKSNILEYIIKKEFQSLTRVDEIFNKYKLFIENNKIDNNLFLENSRPVEAILTRLDNVIYSRGKMFRYYPFNSFDFATFLEIINIQQYENSIFSTKLIFDNNLDLMNDYDINDEYELHALLRKLFEKNYLIEKINFSRSPIIKFNMENHKEQIINFLNEFSPIHKNDFQEKYSKYYGFNKESFTSNSFIHIKEFITKDNILSIDNPDNFISDDDIQKIKSNLVNEIYKTNDFYKIISKSLDNNINFIPIYTLEKLEFKRNDNYFYSSKFPNFADAIFNVYLKGKNYIKIPDDIAVFDKDNFWKDRQANNTITILKQTNKIFPINNNYWISIEKLTKNGLVTIEDIKNFVNNVYNFVKNDYFTIQSLNENGFSDKLFNLGFEDIFYENLLSQSNKISSISKKQKIFLKKSNKNSPFLSFNNFIEDTINKYFWNKQIQHILFDDFIEVIKENYKLYNLDEYKIKEILKDLGYYINDISDIIYMSKNIFYDKLKK